MAFTMTDVLVPNKDIAFREIAEEVVILDLDKGSYFGLNPVASRAWAVLLEQRTLAQVHAALLAEYDVDASRLEADLMVWAARLVEKGLLQTA